MLKLVILSKATKGSRMDYTYLTINKLIFNRNIHTEICFEILSLTLDPPYGRVRLRKRQFVTFSPLRMTRVAIHITKTPKHIATAFRFLLGVFFFSINDSVYRIKIFVFLVHIYKHPYAYVLRWCFLVGSIGFGGCLSVCYFKIKI